MTRSLIRSTLLYLPAQLLAPFVQFAVVVTWTHLLDPAAFGVVTFVVAAQELAALFAILWWSMYMLRFQQRFSEADGTRFRSMDSRMVVYGAASQVIFAPLCLLAIGVPLDAAAVAASAAYLISRMMLAHYSEWARSHHRIAAYSLAQIAGPILGSLLSVVAILIFGPSPAAALAAMAIGQAVGALGLMKALNLSVSFGHFDRQIFDDARRYGLPLVFSGIFAWLAINGVRLLVQASEGVVGVGLFSAGWGLGQRIANVIAMLCTAAAYPIAVDKMESGDKAGALRQTALNGALMFSLLAPAALGVALLSAPVVNLLIAEQYRAITIIILPIAVATGALRTLKTHTADQACLLLNQTKANLASSIFDATVTLIFATIGLLVGGIVGAALGCLVGTIVSASTSIGYAVVKLGMPTDAADYGRILASTAGMACVVGLAPPPMTFIQLALTIVLGVVAYVVATLTVFPRIREAARQRLWPARWLR